MHLKNLCMHCRPAARPNMRTQPWHVTYLRYFWDQTPDGTTLSASSSDCSRSAEATVARYAAAAPQTLPCVASPALQPPLLLPAHALQYSQYSARLEPLLQSARGERCVNPKRHYCHKVIYLWCGAGFWAQDEGYRTTISARICQVYRRSIGSYL